MAARISASSIARPWLPLLLAIALAALSLPLFSHLPEHLGIGPLQAPGEGEAAIEVSATPDPAVTPRVAAVAIGAIRAQLESDPRVGAVKGAGGGGLQVALADDSPQARIDAIASFRSEIDPGPLTIEIGGSETDLQAARASLGGDLWRIAILILPFALLALSALSGWRWALTSLLAAICGLMLAMGLVRILGSIFDVSLLAVAVAAPVAVAGALEVACALGYRAFDLPAGASRPDRLEAAVSEGVRDALSWVALAILAGAVAALSGFEQAGSLGLGAIAGALAAFVAGCLLATSALAFGWEFPLRHFAIAGDAALRLASSGGPGGRGARTALLALRLAALGCLLAAVPIAAYLLRDDLADAFDALAPAGADGAAIACALAAGIAIVAGRTAVALRIGREARLLGAGPGAAAATTAEASLSAALASGLLLAALGALLQITDLGAAGEYGVVLAAIVLADALLGRLACAVLPAVGRDRGEQEVASAAEAPAEGERPEPAG